MILSSILPEGGLVGALLPALLLTTSDASERGRPWHVEGSFRTRVEAHARESDGDRAAKLSHARWCRDAGAFGGMAEALSSVAGKEPVGDDVAELFGYVAGSKERRPEGLERFAAGAPEVGARLAPPDDRTRRQLLKDRFRDIRLANKSTYFDLWTDLDATSLEVYTATLNDFYRQLKNRFRTYLTTNIDVILFASRSDYLIDYAVSFGKNGEHILGYYLPGLRRLVFYDDRDGLEEVLVTAKHECTHLIVDLGFGAADLPPWFDEGLACFLSADGVEARGVYTAGLVLELQERLALDRPQGLRDLFAVTQAKLTYEHYAWSWSLLHFLHATGRERAFEQFLDRLRERAPDVEARDVPEVVVTAFTDSFGADLEGLEREWWGWLREQFALERPDQFLDLARAALKRARGLEPGRARERLIDVAEVALRSVDDEALRGERRLLWWECVVSRDDRGDDPLAHRLLLRGLRDELRSLPEDHRRSDLARTAVLAFAEGVGVRRKGAGPFDLRAALVERAAKRADSAGDELRAALVVADDLLGLAFEGLKARLEAQPLDRGAAQAWLRLAMDVAPSRLAEILPTFRLLVELDPDDRNLASLGVVYHGLGREKYGRTLVEEGTSRALREGLVEEYRQWIGLR